MKDQIADSVIKHVLQTKGKSYTTSWLARKGCTPEEMVTIFRRVEQLPTKHETPKPKPPVHDARQKALAAMKERHARERERDKQQAKQDVHHTIIAVIVIVAITIGAWILLIPTMQRDYLQDSCAIASKHLLQEMRQEGGRGCFITHTRRQGQYCSAFAQCSNMQSLPTTTETRRRRAT